MTTETNLPTIPAAPPAARTQAVIEAELAAIENGLQNNVQLPVDNDDEAEDAKLQTETRAVDAATRKGWVPRDQFKGEEGKWVDAQTFLERGERFNANLQRENAELRNKIKSFEGTQKAFKAYMDEVVSRKDAQLASLITELRVQRSAAIREGDDGEAIALEDRIDLLKEERKNVKAIPTEGLEQENEGETPKGPPTPSMQDPVIEEWIEDNNTWFRDDIKMRDYSIKMGQKLIADGETIKGRRFLDKITELMRQEFPRRFRKFDEEAGRTTSTPPRSPVEGAPSRAGIAPKIPGGKTERDLPPADLELMKQFIKEGWVTREKFLVDYFSRN